MSGNFYEVLGIRKDASSEDVRKAYRKMALKTHPDRLPPGATAEEKKVSEEKFRKVNNAYEILIDPKNRKLYDQHGVWPPPQELPTDARRERSHASGHRHSHGPDPFDNFFNFPRGDPFGRHHRPRHAFSDPFEMFNAMFAEMHHDTHAGFSPMFPRPSDTFWGSSHPVLGRPPAGFHSPLFPPPPGPLFHSFFDSPFIPDEPQGSSSRPNPHRQEFAFESSGYYGARAGSDGPQWVSESSYTRTINGVTQSVRKRRDRDGNEHVTYTYPDGREKYTVNGVEQPRGNIQGSRSTDAIDPRYTPPPPVIPPEQAGDSTRKHWWRRH